jgi:hypothetical protein
MHQKYLDQGEAVYIGKPDSVEFSAGNKRVRFTWFLNADPRIDRSIFYWNEGKDSAVIAKTQSGSLKMDTILDVKEEGLHTFSLVTKDDENHKSMSVERTVLVYGPTYISRLTNRNISSSSFSDGKLTINWVAIESSLIQYSTVYYTDNSEQKSIRVENDVDKTEILDIDGDTFSITTSYLPDGGLDILETLPAEYIIK